VKREVSHKAKSNTVAANVFAPYQRPKYTMAIFLAVVMIVVGVYTAYKTFAASGALTLSPTSSSPSLGSTFTVSIFENSGSDTVNAVQSDLTYPTSQLQFVSIDGTGSAFSIDAQADGSTAGKVLIGRGTSGGTTVTGSQLVTTVTFRAIGLGAANITFANTSHIVTNGNPPTDVLVTATGGTYTVVDTSAPSTPTGLTAATRNVTSIALSWTAATDNVGVTSYKIFRNGTQVGSSGSTSFTDTGLAPNTSYSYTITANDAAGNASSQSTTLNTSTVPDTTAPNPPTGLTAPTKTMTSIDLSWTAPTDNVGVTGYKIFRGGTQIGTSANATFSDTGLTPNTQYSYTVAATDAATNTSAQSSALVVSTLPDTLAPSVPTSLNSPSQTNTTLNLAWTGSTDNVAVTVYKIFRNGTQIGTSATTNYADSTGLVAGTSYSYTVAAADAAGNTSAQSTALSLTLYKGGDINRDSAVNVFDLSIVLSNYGKTRAQSTNADADIDGNGTVDIFDLSILLSNYGK
jgi:chitodextrinase